MEGLRRGRGHRWCALDWLCATKTCTMPHGLEWSTKSARQRWGVTLPLEHFADSVLPTASALRRTGKLITMRSEEGEATP
jgi:hypothetical protein